MGIYKIGRASSAATSVGSCGVVAAKLALLTYCQDNIVVLKFTLFNLGLIIL